LATEKQIAANRANAKRSTGPRTLAGKMKSSHNAFRHGLSGPLPLDPAALARIDSLASLLAGDEADEARLTLAAEFAMTQLELLQIRAERNRMMATLNLQSGDLESITRLQALDRYERYAHTKRRRASHKL
jgi:hypothetical protein